MFTTISISIRPLLFSAFIFTLLSSCQRGESNQSAVPNQHTGTDPEEKRKGKETDFKLSDENAESFLRDYGKQHTQNTVVVSTRYGEIRIRLYDNTPLHRANFLYLTHKGYFDNTWFYRVSKDHVIQAGNTDSPETVKKRRRLGEYEVPSEIDAGNYHKYGAVAAARSYFQNPEKDSDPYEFYIVLGKAYSRNQLTLLAEKHDLEFSKDQLDFYENRRGAPHLDKEHTVFGEVIEGMDVVEKINSVKVDEGEWPLMNIPIEVEVVK